MIGGKSALAVPPFHNPSSQCKILTRGHIFSRSRVAIWLYFIICVAVFGIRTAHWKQVNDPAQLHYLCFLMDHGMPPYLDLFEITMPHIYLVTWSVMHSLGA